MLKSKVLAYVAFLLPVLLINASAVGPHSQKINAQNRISEAPRLHQRAPSCPGFEGNSDFYGLGIRLGVYLQWIASWLTNTLSPNEAGRSHDANSIFVLAVVTAIFTSIASGNIKPVEVYIMLLICFGFFFTVLSFLGMRLYFLTPASIASMVERTRMSLTSWYASKEGGWEKVLRRLKAALADTSSTGGFRLLKAMLDVVKMSTVDMSFTSASSVKYHYLSWSGVFWRTAIASMVASVNIYLWWFPWRLRQNAADATQCDAVVFFFGRQELSPTMVTFFKAVSIILAVPIFWLFLVLYIVLRAMLWLTMDVISHRFFGPKFGDSRLFRSWNKLPEPVKKYFFSRSFLPTSSVSFGPFLDILELYTNSGTVEHAGVPLNQEPAEKHENPPSLNDLVKAYIGFLSRGTEETEGNAPQDTQAGSVLQGLCVVFHAVLLTTMACFIVFIELTLTANSISGVYTLQATGQLIPFIIGITSLAAAIREIALRYVTKQHPDFHLVSLKVDLAAGTGRVEMRQKSSDESAPKTVHGTQTAVLNINSG